MTIHAHPLRAGALALALVLVVAATGYGASTGSQSVTITVAAAIDITVPASATIASTAPPNCGTTSTTVNVKSNKPYNLQIRSNPGTYPNGKAKNAGSVELVNAFEWSSNGGVSYSNITSSYANMFGSNQPKTASTNHTANYRQCIDYLDDPDTYTITVEYQGVQP